MLYRVKVREVIYHNIMVEAEDEEQAMEKWWDRFGDSDFDEIDYDDVEPECLYAEEEE